MPEIGRVIVFSYVSYPYIWALGWKGFLNPFPFHITMHLDKSHNLYKYCNKIICKNLVGLYVHTIKSGPQGELPSSFVSKFLGIVCCLLASPAG
jgi:hypothetical protein